MSSIKVITFSRIYLNFEKKCLTTSLSLICLWQIHFRFSTIYNKIKLKLKGLYPSNINLIKNMEDIVVFLTRKVFFFSLSFSICTFKLESHFRRETANKNMQKRFLGYHCKSGIAIFASMFIWNIASSSFQPFIFSYISHLFEKETFVYIALRKRAKFL